jgi:hypothetical protein
MRKYHDVKDLEDEQMKAKLDRLSIGCFVVVFEAEDGAVEPTVMHRFSGNLSSMIQKENLFSLHMRYLSAEERAQCGTIIEQQSLTSVKLD